MFVVFALRLALSAAPSSDPVAPIEPPEAASSSPAELPETATPAPAPLPDPPELDPEPPLRAIVRERRPVAPPTTASDLRLRPAPLADVPRRDAEQLFTLAPGVTLSQHAGRYHGSTIFLRGFDAGEGQDVAVSVLGAPLNEVGNPHGHGYVDTHFLPPELVDELRVLPGPFDVTVGDFGLAGAVELRPGLARGVHAALSLGSFDERRLLLAYGPEARGVGTFAAAELRSGDGFGPNRAHRAGGLHLGWEERLRGGTTLRLYALGHAARFDSAGVVRLPDVEQGALPCPPGWEGEARFCLHDSNQGGASSRVGLLTEARTTDGLTAHLSLMRRRLRLRENWTGWLHDPPIDGLGDRGDGVEQRYEATTVAADVRQRFSPALAGWSPALELGGALRNDAADVVLRRLRRPGGDPYATLLNESLDVTDVGLFGAAELPLPAGLTARVGLRVEQLFFSAVDHEEPSATRSGARVPESAFDADGLAWLPRAGLSYRPLEALELVTSFGVGLRSAEAVALGQGEAAPFARARSAELGAIGRGALGPVEAEARLVGFHTFVERDLLFDERVGRNVLADPSNRWGVSAALAAELPRRATLRASWGRTEAYRAPDGAGFSVDGGRLPYVPRDVARLDLAATIPLPWSGLRARPSVGLSYTGERPLPLEELTDPVTLLDAGLVLRAGPIELGGQVTNLLDEAFAQAEYLYASNFVGPGAPVALLPVRHVAAGPPRSFLFTVAYRDTPEEDE